MHAHHITLSPLYPSYACLFHNSLAFVEAISKLLVVLVRGVIGQHLLARGALEGLEAGFALDGLCGGVLSSQRALANVHVLVALWTSFVKVYGGGAETEETHGFELRLGFLGTAVALAIALLLCSRGFVRYALRFVSLMLNVG